MWDGGGAKKERKRRSGLGGRIWFLLTLSKRNCKRPSHAKKMTLVLVIFFLIVLRD